MAKKYYEEVTTCVRAIDLIKIANQLFNDGMQYVKIGIVQSSYEDEEGNVKISAIPSVDSVSPKHYPSISSFTAVDTDVFESYN